MVYFFLSNLINYINKATAFYCGFGVKKKTACYRKFKLGDLHFLKTVASRRLDEGICDINGGVLVCGRPTLAAFVYEVQVNFVNWYSFMSLQ